MWTIINDIISKPVRCDSQKNVDGREDIFIHSQIQIGMLMEKFGMLMEKYIILIGGLHKFFLHKTINDTDDIENIINLNFSEAGNARFFNKNFKIHF